MITLFLTYELKVAVLIAVFYIFWRLLVANETWHRINRIVLLSTAVASFVLPLCVITIHQIVEVEPIPMEEIAENSVPRQLWCEHSEIVVEETPEPDALGIRLPEEIHYLQLHNGGQLLPCRHLVEVCPAAFQPQHQLPYRRIEGQREESRALHKQRRCERWW